MQSARGKGLIELFNGFEELTEYGWKEKTTEAYGVSKNDEISS